MEGSSPLKGSPGIAGLGLPSRAERARRMRKMSLKVCICMHECARTRVDTTTKN